MAREFLKNIKSENRLEKIRLIMKDDYVIGGQPTDGDAYFNSNTPFLDIACTMKFSIDLGKNASKGAQDAKYKADEAHEIATGAAHNANNRIPKKDVLVSRDPSKEKVVSGFLLDETIKEFENKSSYSSKQNRLFARFMRKLKEDGGAKINCVGTSNTSKNKGHISYPEALQEALRDVYQNDVTVTNMGISGGTVASNFKKWKDNTPVADLTIMEFTANDQARTEIGKFVDDLEEYIEYELDNDRAVLLITAPKMDKTTNIRRDVYSAAMYGVASKYSIYILDTEMLFANYPSSIHYDGIHANSEGGTVLGYKVAAIFTGEGIHNPRTVTNGSNLLGRPTIDSLIFGPNTRQFIGNETPPHVITPNETDSVRGVTANFSGQIGKSYLYYGFYAESDNLYITPSIKLYPGASIKFTLDGGTISPKYSLNNTDFVDTSIKISDDNTYFFKNETSKDVYNSAKTHSFDPIPLVTAGWHILKIEVENDICVLYGLSFSAGNFREIHTTKNTTVSPKGFLRASGSKESVTTDELAVTMSKSKLQAVTPFLLDTELTKRVPPDTRKRVDVTKDRIKDVEYTNTTDLPIDIDINVELSGINFESRFTFYVNNKPEKLNYLMSGSPMNYANTQKYTKTILPGEKYKFETGGEVKILMFEEFRK